MNESLPAAMQAPSKKPSPIYYVIVVVLVLVAAGGGFFSGLAVGKSGATAASEDSPGRIGQNGASGMGRMGNFGTVTAVSSDSITITVSQMGPTQDTSDTSSASQSKTYKITSDTAVTDNQSTAAVSDIKSGDTVMIRTSSSDTSTASRITINPSMGNGGMGGPAQGSSDNNVGSDTTDGSST